MHERQSTASRAAVRARRRMVLAAGVACLALPWAAARAQGKQVVVRTGGGGYDEAKRASVYDPFTKETGIEIVLVAANQTKMLALARAGAPDIDVYDTNDETLLQLDRDKLYPIDIERAFKSLSRVRPAIVKFWETGAMAAQMLADGETVLSAISNSRVQAIRDKGGPVAISWNQNLVNVTATAITKTARNPVAARMFVDYVLSPAVQERWLNANREFPINRKAYGGVSRDLIDPDTGKPWTVSRGITKDARWWADNRQRVSERWSKWIIS